MTQTDEQATLTHDLVITRVFDAPREQVWQAWTNPEHLMRWWGPAGYTAPACTIDFRVGGNYHNVMRSPEGQDYWGTGVYKEIVPLERIVFTDSFADAEGNVVPPSHYGFDDSIPLETLVTVTFESIGDQTRMTLTQSRLPIGDILEGTHVGWNESFDKMAASLKAA